MTLTHFSRSQLYQNALAGTLRPFRSILNVILFLGGGTSYVGSGISTAEVFDKFERK